MPSASSFRPAAFTGRAKVKLRALVSAVSIANIEPLRKPNVKPRGYQAIWDTGATSTVVTKKVVEECGLVPVSKTKVIGVHGDRISDVFLIDVHLPNNVAVTEVPVTEADALAGDSEVLIGMDIIGLGDFAVSNFQGETSFTFRMPSLKHIDFVEDLADEVVDVSEVAGVPKVGRNQQCPCGSGKKYKKCHGA